MTLSELREQVLIILLGAVVLAAISFITGRFSTFLKKRFAKSIQVPSQDDSRRARRNRNSLAVGATRIVSVIGGLGALVVVVLVGVITSQPPGAATSEPTPSISVSNIPASLIPSTPSRPATKVSSHEGCPPVAAGDSADASVVIDVLYWCTAQAFFDDGTVDPSKIMVKVRPMLRNDSSNAIRIGIDNPSAMRLLVMGTVINHKWSPPPLTASLGDAPIMVVCDGEQMWAIPPNSPSETYGAVNGRWLGHATYWDFTTLAPEEILYRPVHYETSGKVIKEANLVFTIPVEDSQDLGIYGLAIVDAGSGNILGSSHIDDWPGKVLPGSF